MKNKSKQNNKPNNVRFIKMRFKINIESILPKELSMSRKNQRKRILHKNNILLRKVNMLKKCNNALRINNINQRKENMFKRHISIRKEDIKIVFSIKQKTGNKFKCN